MVAVGEPFPGLFPGWLAAALNHGLVMAEWAVHPASALLLWLGLLIVVQCLDGPKLLMALPVVVLLCGYSALPDWRRLVWAARWLLLSMFLILALGGEGEPLWDGESALRREGVGMALVHVGRLLLMLLIVAAVRRRMSVNDLLSASYRLLEPLRRLGVDPSPGIVRLLLVVRQLEAMPRIRDWRVLFEVEAQTGPLEDFELTDKAFTWRDYAVQWVLAGCLAGIVLRYAV